MRPMLHGRTNRGQLRRRCRPVVDLSEAPDIGPQGVKTRGRPDPCMSLLQDAKVEPAVGLSSSGSSWGQAVDDA